MRLLTSAVVAFGACAAASAPAGACQWWTGAMVGCAEQFRDYTRSEFFMELQKASVMGNVKSMIALGDDAYKFGRYAEAMRWYKQALGVDNNDRLLRVAEMYADGQGVAADPATAQGLYRRAMGALAHQALSDQWTAFDLAMLYRDGKGGPVDLAKAASLFQVAAGQGNVPAMVELGAIQVRTGHVADGVRNLEAAAQQRNVSALGKLAALYDDGTLVPRDRAKALRLYEEAADAGDVWGLVQIGDMYAAGDGTAKNEAKAQQWWGKAVALLPKSAEEYPYLKYQLAGLYRDGKGVAKDPARAQQLCEAAADAGDASARHDLAYGNGTNSLSRMLAIKWSKALADGGNNDVLEHLADLLQAEGQTSQAASTWIRAASYYRGRAATDAASAYRLGLLYRAGKGVPQDVPEAMRWLTVAAESEQADAQQALAELYLQSGPKGAAQALRWYERSAKNGNTAVLETLGNLYAGGKGTAIDLAKAQGYWADAARIYERDSATSPWAVYSLGELYATGHGVPLDIVKARQLLTQAQHAGVGQAEGALARLDAAILEAANL